MALASQDVCYMTPITPPSLGIVPSTLKPLYVEESFQRSCQTLSPGRLSEESSSAGATSTSSTEKRPIGFGALFTKTGDVRCSTSMGFCSSESIIPAPSNRCFLVTTGARNHLLGSPNSLARRVLLDISSKRYQESTLNPKRELKQRSPEPPCPY